MQKLIVANWKMNPETAEEAKKLFDSVKNGVKKVKNIEVVICPPFIYLPLLKGLALGAQNVFYKESGAFTGEVSPLMLKNLNVQYVILGHSERRNYFGETNEIVNKKIKAALRAKLSPIFCVGESQKERAKGNTKLVLRSQIGEGLKGVKKGEVQNLVLAYEPIWAIGRAGENPREAQTMGLYARQIIAKLFSLKVAKKIKILYGGKVNSKNAISYVKEAGFDGLLVGGASLDGREFSAILKSIVRA
ncbi:MAG: triose-phosphate isomerase [Patescibacteria group bacterium]